MITQSIHQSKKNSPVFRLITTLGWGVCYAAAIAGVVYLPLNGVTYIMGRLFGM